MTQFYGIHQKEVNVASLKFFRNINSVTVHQEIPNLRFI